MTGPAASEAPAGHGSGTTALRWLAPVLPLALFLALLTLLPAITGGQTVRVAWSWVPSLDVQLSFYVDGLSLLFALLITGIGTFIFLYAGTYLHGHPRLARFYLYLTLFMASMLGLVLADNLITLFVFWELTTVSSYLLIGFDCEKAEARRNALQALLVTGIGGLAMLAGFILLGTAAGSFELSEINADGAAIREHALYLPILALVLAGAFTKSAQFPFHFWLPNAMAAPTPVSAYLHSATMVKAGIYLMARVHPTLGGTDWWMWTLLLFGAVTAVWASLMAVRQTDLKLMLAHTTVMALGTLTMFLGAEVKIGIAAAVTFILVHSLYKASMFLVVGIIDHETGTREVDRLGGLRKAMPITFLAAAAAGFSMAGFPPFLGFIGKELKYEGALAITHAPVFMTAAALAANALMVAVAATVVFRPFLGQRTETPRAAHEAPWSMWIGPAVLATLGLVFGMAPGIVGVRLVEPTVEAILYRPEDVSLKLWHGINLPLMLSVLTVLLGLAAFRWRKPLAGGLNWLVRVLPTTGDRAYDATLAGMMAFATWQSGVLQNGRQRRYLLVVVATFVLAVGGTLVVFDGVAWPTNWSVPLYAWGVLALILAGTAGTILTRSRLGAVTALGAVGTGSAVLFLMYGAPDVAMTQLMVETLVVVIVALVLPHLPGLASRGHSGRFGRWRDCVVAIGAGTVVALLVLAVTTVPLDRDLTTFFEQASVPEAFGRNIVNVILVDFRAIDTFGEVAVVAIAGLASYALVKSARRRRGAK